MPQSRFDFRFILRSIFVTLGLCLLVYVVHTSQMKRHAADQLELAEQAVQNDDANEYIVALNRSLGFDPRNKEVRARHASKLAETATDNRDRWRAIRALRQVMAESPEDSEARLHAVEMALALGEAEQAARYLKPLLRKEPDRANLHVLAARCHLARGNPTGAVESLKRAMELEPGRTEIAEILAEVYWDRLQTPRSVQALLDRFVAANPSSPSAHLARARCALRESKFDAASRDLETAARLDPRSIEVVRTQAEVATLQGAHKRASELWNRAIELAPDQIPLYLSLAKAEQERGKTDVAIDVLRKALELAPHRTDLIFLLADLLIEGGKVAEGRDLQVRLEKAAPGQAEFLAGRLAQREKRWLDAINAFIAALRASDVGGEQSGRTYFELSRCYAALGGRVEEMQALESAARSSSATQPRLVFAQRLVEEKRFPDATPLLRELAALKSPPTLVWGLLARVLVEQNRLLPMSQRRWSEVENAIDRAGTDPQQAMSLALVKADTHTLNDKVDQAIEVLEAACKAHPDQPDPYLALAETYSENRQPDKARAVLARGDEAVKDRLDWLRLRIGRATKQTNEQSHSELLRLESRLEKLGDSDRERLERHLVAAYIRMGNHPEVERLCLRMLRHQPGDAQVRLWLVDSLLAQDDLREAKQHLGVLRKVEGEQGLGWRCATADLLMRKSGEGEKDRLAEARELIQYARKARPNWSLPIFLQAYLEDKEGKTDAALADYRRVLELGEYRPHALSRVVDILDGKKQWAEALAICERALQRGLLDHAMLRVVANLAVKTNQKIRARDIAELIVPEDNRNYHDQIWLGNLLDSASLSESARNAFKRAVQLAPDVVEPYLALMTHYVRHRRQAEADELFGRMKTAFAGSAIAVARGYETLAQPGKAELAYREILKRRPNDPEALDRLAALLVRYDENRRAEPILLRLLDPRFRSSDEAVALLRRQLSLVLAAPEQSEDRVDQALNLLALSKPRNDQHAIDARHRALVLGRRADRRAEALEALEALPTGSMTPQEQLRLARLYDAHGNGTRARTLLADLIQQDPVNATLISSLIESLLRDKRRTDSIEWIERLEKLEPGSVRVKEFRRKVNKG